MLVHCLERASRLSVGRSGRIRAGPARAPGVRSSARQSVTCIAVKREQLDVLADTSFHTRALPFAWSGAAALRRTRCIHNGVRFPGGAECPARALSPSARVRDGFRVANGMSLFVSEMRLLPSRATHRLEPGFVAARSVSTRRSINARLALISVGRPSGDWATTYLPHGWSIENAPTGSRFDFIRHPRRGGLESCRSRRNCGAERHW